MDESSNLPATLPKMGLLRRFAAGLRLGAATMGSIIQDSNLPEELLRAIFPARRGDPPRRGTPGLLRAYSDMPWLRAVTGKIAGQVATTQWHVYAAQKGNPTAKRIVRDMVWQRAPVDERRKILKGLKRKGEVREFFEHPFLEAWQGRGGYLTGMQIRKLTQTYLDVVGEAPLLRERNAQGVTVGFWPIPPSWIVTTPTPIEPWYTITFRNERVEVPASEMFWIHEPDLWYPYGRSTGIGGSLADELDTQEFASKHVRSFFFNSARPDFIAWVKPPQQGVFQPPTQTELERMKQRWLLNFQNVYRRYAPHFIARELGIYEFKQDMQSLQAIPLLEHERDTIIQVYGMPPEIMGIINESKRSTIDVAAFHMGLFVVQPRLEFLRDQFQERLIPEYDDRIVLEYDSPIPEDREFALNVLKTTPTAFTVDDVRDLSGLDIWGPENGGDLVPVPINITMTPQDELEAPKPTPVNDNGDGGGEGTKLPLDDGTGSSTADSTDGADKSVKKWNHHGHPRWSAREKGAREAALLINRVAERLEPRLRKLFLEAIARAQGEINTADLEAALKSGDVQKVLDVLKLENIGAKLEGTGGLRDILAQAVQAGGEAAAEATGSMLGVELTFTSQHTEAMKWAKDRAGTMIREIDAETRAAVRRVVARAFEVGMPPRESAKQIENIVGLTRRQTAQVIRFQEKLEADGVDAAQVDRRVADYASAVLQRRAATIARTETLAAANKGQQSLWDQAVKDGNLQTEQWRKIVIVTDDDRLDVVVCEPMPDMDENQNVPIDGIFVTGEGEEYDGPPFHPNCRCAVGLERVEEDDGKKGARPKHHHAGA